MTVNIVEIVINVLALSFMPVAYISCYPFGIYLRRYIALRNIRMQKWFLLAALVISLIMFGATIQSKMWNSCAGMGIGKAEIFEDDDYDGEPIGKIEYTQDFETREVTAISYMEIKGDYYKVSIEDGKVIAPGAAEKYSDDAARAIKRSAELDKDFSATSIPYNELENREDLYYFSMKWTSWLISMIVVFGPFAAIMTDLMIEKMRRSRRNKLLKTRLKDL